MKNKFLRKKLWILVELEILYRRELLKPKVKGLIKETASL
jgi:hypothetical protein